MAMNEFPFMNMDFGKMMNFDMAKAMQDFRMPGMDMDKMATSYRKNMEALAAANQLAAEGYQAVAKRQAEILKQGMEEMVSGLKGLMSAGSPEASANKQADMAKQAFERALANARELAELVAKSNSEALDIINKRVAESLEELKSLNGKA